MNRFIALAVMVLASTALASAASAADVARGQRVFGECGGCHGLGPHAPIKAGPPLNGIVGRRWAAYPGYHYSAALSAGGKAGKTWTVAELDQWLTNPHKLVPGTKMGFGGLPNPRDRREVIAYMEQYNAQGVKTPAH